NTGLRNRAGATTTQTNAGSRTVQYTPLYLLLDALNAMDDAHDTDPEGTASWYAARSRLIDIFLATEPLANDRFRLANRRVHAISQIALGFTDEQIAKHRAAGDLTTWARALDDDLEEVLGGALASRLVRFLDALNEYPETQRTFLELTQYLLDEASHNDAFENLLLTAADALFLLEDDETLVVLMRSVADALAVGAKAAVEGTGTISVEGSIADEGVSLLNKSNEVDTARTMTALLANAVTHPPGELETPIEVILDVVAEVNRATPNAGGPLAPNDHGAVMRQVFEFLGDEDRGLERVYDVVQSRESVQ
ncbi:MAG: hypothetical protein H5U40_06450, partial [Polyangiaceae bacterium]|nr:hypothetical protein [Polyangiaceae bacterium]